MESTFVEMDFMLFLLFYDLYPSHFLLDEMRYPFSFKIMLQKLSFVKQHLEK